MALALGLMNVLTYALTVLAARRLGPAGYGTFAAVMALVLVLNILSLGLTAATARRIAQSPDRVGLTARAGLAGAWTVGLPAAALVLVLVPALTRVVHADSWATLALLAPIVLILALIGSRVGVLQGMERWSLYSLVFITLGVTRLVAGWLGLDLTGTPLGVMSGVTAGFVVTLLATEWAVQRAHVPPWTGPVHRRAVVGLLREGSSATSVLGGFLLLSTVDVLIAQARLGAQPAGLYAGGLILTKAVMFLPYFVSVLIFPRLARGGSVHLQRWGLAGVVGLGLLVAAASALLPTLTMTFIGGGRYVEVRTTLWAFAVLGTAFAGIQLLVNTALARRHTRVGWIVWGALVPYVVFGLRSHSWRDLLQVSLAVSLTVLVILTVISWRDRVTARDLTADA